MPREPGSRSANRTNPIPSHLRYSLHDANDHGGNSRNHAARRRRPQRANRSRPGVLRAAHASHRVIACPGPDGGRGDHVPGQGDVPRRRRAGDADVGARRPPRGVDLHDERARRSAGRPRASRQARRPRRPAPGGGHDHRHRERPPRALPRAQRGPDAAASRPPRGRRARRRRARHAPAGRRRGRRVPDHRCPNRFSPTTRFHASGRPLVSRLSELALSKRSVALLLAIALFIAGISAWGSLKQELLPDIQLPVFTVVAADPGAGASDVADQIAKPIERAISGIARLERVQSTSANSIALVVAQFSYGTNVKDTKAAIVQNVSALKLPANVTPQVSSLDINASPVTVSYTHLRAHE